MEHAHPSMLHDGSDAWYGESWVNGIGGTVIIHLAAPETNQRAIGVPWGRWKTPWSSHRWDITSWRRHLDRNVIFITHKKRKDIERLPESVSNIKWTLYTLLQSNIAVAHTPSIDDVPIKTFVYFWDFLVSPFWLPEHNLRILGWWNDFLPRGKLNQSNNQNINHHIFEMPSATSSYHVRSLQHM